MKGVENNPLITVAVNASFVLIATNSKNSNLQHSSEQIKEQTSQSHNEIANNTQHDQTHQSIYKMGKLKVACPCGKCFEQRARGARLMSITLQKEQLMSSVSQLYLRQSVHVKTPRNIFCCSAVQSSLLSSELQSERWDSQLLRAHSM